MKKFFAVVAAALVIALILWAALRMEQAHRQLRVTELLPKRTILVAEVPDCDKAREQWHGSDVYAIWREPAVQGWLQKSLTQLRRSGQEEQTLKEFLHLGPTDTFLALTSIENNEPKIVGGFHFKQSAAEVRQFVDAREAPWLAKGRATRGKAVTHNGHQIETIQKGHFVLATVFDRNWFFVANDLSTLEAVLDRADRRGDKAASALPDDEGYKVAAKHLPNDYAGMFFFQPQPLLEKLRPVIALTGQTFASAQLAKLNKIQSVAGAVGFDGGKMRESIFTVMPRSGPEEKLAQSALPSAGTDTFFYSDALTAWPGDWKLAPAGAQTSLPAFLQPYDEALVRQGVSQDDLRLAFGAEIEMFGEWSAQARWPAFSALLSVKDGARARKIADALASVELAGATWTRSDKNGVSYYSLPAFGGFVPVAPAIAVSDRLLVVGSDASAVEKTMTEKMPASGQLAKSAKFRDAVARVPAAGVAFDYLDTQLLFERADATVRPLLLLGATIYPAWGNKFDASKLPPADAITKHLSPIVMSDRYVSDGYLTESVGPIPWHGAIAGFATIAGGLFFYFHQGTKAGGFLHPKAAIPAPSVSTVVPAVPPSATPTPSPP
ncbi:MAG TPA: hypothetical protein VGI85_12900 [Chthoniobacterales bacterium]|jgi:hypothetical protein